MSTPVKFHPNHRRIELVLSQWLAAPVDVYGSKNYAAVTTAMQKSWPDFQMCAYPSCANPNKLIGETSHLYPKNEYKECGMCLKSGEPIFTFKVPATFKLEAADEMFDAYDVIRKECQDDAQKRKDANNDNKDLRQQGYQTAYVSDELLLKERNAWYSLMTVAFDVIRPRLIVLMKKWNEEYEQVVDADGGDVVEMSPQAMDLTLFLRKAVSYHNTRAELLTPPQIYCYLHNRLGHALPTEGRMGYKSCWICRKDDPCGMSTPATSGRHVDEFDTVMKDEDDQKHPDSPRDE